MFVCFAPKENPKIAIAVFVQNAGFGSTWAGPISRIMIEKYLNDTLQTKSKADLERIANTNLMPAYFKRLQYKEDSVRAERWLREYKDSSLLKKFLNITWIKERKPANNPGQPAIPLSRQPVAAILTAERYLDQPNYFAHS